MTRLHTRFSLPSPRVGSQPNEMMTRSPISYHSNCMLLETWATTCAVPARSSPSRDGERASAAFDSSGSLAVVARRTSMPAILMQPMVESVAPNGQDACVCESVACTVYHVKDEPRANNVYCDVMTKQKKKYKGNDEGAQQQSHRSNIRIALLAVAVGWIALVTRAKLGTRSL
ncbi:hypothetical protein EDB85DRAFT_1950964 [Lactarius pseudohatsudake]|nr:hypothetical protein EDB85DRAFT_1950964 [Lactarius pseudohatsudake]